MAVRRHITATGSDGRWIVGEGDLRAIRAHFRAITRTYGVVGTVAMMNDGDNTAADYDGHSLRH